MGEPALKLVIRGPAAASKTQGLQVKLTITGKVDGSISFTLKDVISNDIIVAKPGSAQRADFAGNGELAINFNLGDFFDTPKTGAYLARAVYNNSVTSNELAVKILL